MNDFLETRSTNINIRVSLRLKAKLTERAADKGMSITDFVLHQITRAETLPGELEKLTIEHDRLLQKANDLARMESTIDSTVKKMIGEEVRFHDQKVVVRDKFHALELIFKTLKTT